MNMSASMADRLSTVSSRVSPLLVDEAPMLRLITSADRRLAAISKVVRVRVEFSKNKLKMALPRKSGTFLTSRSAMETKDAAVSSMRSTTSLGNPSSVSKCCSSPFLLSCGLRIGSAAFFARRLHRQSEAPLLVAREHDLRIAHAGDARADVLRFDGQLASAAIDEHRQLHARRPTVIEQLVHGRTH